MKKGKNYFYRVNPIEVLAEVIYAENKEKWFLQFFDDLKKDDPLDCKTELAREYIKEAHGYRLQRSKAGKASAEQRATDVEHSLTDVEHSDNETPTSKQLAVSSKQLATTQSKVKIFVPPSVEEVHEYMKSINFDGDPEKWHSFYSAKGWMIGKNKMKDWKAAVRTWRGPVKKGGSNDWEKDFLGEN